MNISFQGDPDTNITAPQFPKNILSFKGERILIPYHEGLSLPADLDKLPTSSGEMTNFYYSQYGLSMGFIGISGENSSVMYVFDTPYDGTAAATKIANYETYRIHAYFEKEKDRFSYERKYRIVFVAGGHVALCKRYREIAKTKGLVVPFTEKVKRKPAIDMLLGSLNFYTGGSYTMNRTDLYIEMQKLGIERILSSQSTTARYIDYMNNNMSHVLSSVYDIYQDITDPEYETKGYLNWHSGWVKEDYPNNIISNSTNQPITFWSVQNLSNPDQWIYLNVLCDKFAPKYAEKRLKQEWADGINYRSRFIDTSFASGYRECYHKDHPMTRTESKEYRVKLLKYFNDQGLVTGSEDGKEVAVPYTDFFEGMMSPGQFRVSGAGRNQALLFTEAPDQITQVMVNESIRVPLFELVYHDCVVSYWYWGDHNCKVLPVWDKKDLLNRLYGTPPILFINQSIYEKYKERIVQSYKTASEVAYKTGYAELIDHVYLTKDCTVQQTLFSNGVRVTVNFGSNPYTTENGQQIKGMDSLVEEGIFPNQAKEGLADWAIALIVIFVLLIVAGGIIAAIIFFRKKKQDTSSTNTTGNVLI